MQHIKFLFIALVLLATLGSMVAFDVQGATLTQATSCTLRSDVTIKELGTLVPGGAGLPSREYKAGENLYEPNTTPPGAGTSTSTTAWGLICLFATVKSITNILFIIVVALDVAVFVYSAFLFLTSGGDPSKTKEARQWLLYGVIGMLVAAAASAIPGIAITLLGINSPG